MDAEGLKEGIGCMPMEDRFEGSHHNVECEFELPEKDGIDGDRLKLTK